MFKNIFIVLLLSTSLFGQDVILNFFNIVIFNKHDTYNVIFINKNTYLVEIIRKLVEIGNRK